MSIYYYVYRITNKIENKHYYGKRTCYKVHPKDDIGVTYFSSSKDKLFKLDQKENPQNYKYKVIKIFNSDNEAIAYESMLHNKFQVAINPNFYNKSKQTKNGFDTTGKVSVKDKENNYFSVSKNDERYLSGELVGVTKGVPLSDLQKKKLSISLKNRKMTQEHKQKLSKAASGKKKSEIHKKKLSKSSLENEITKGKNHPRWKYSYVTPEGTFYSPYALSPIITSSQLKRMCLQCHLIITERSFIKNKYLVNKYTFNEVKNKTYRDLGFSTL